jgi:phosphonoacetaldehyde reductase
VHHGHACGLSLGALLCFNSDVHEKDCADKRGFLHTSKVMGKILNAFNVESASAGERKLHALIKKLGLRTFEQFPGFDLDLIAEQAFASERFRNNPRVMNRRQIQDLVKFLSQPSF